MENGTSDMRESANTQHIKSAVGFEVLLKKSFDLFRRMSSFFPHLPSFFPPCNSLEAVQRSYKCVINYSGFMINLVGTYINITCGWSYLLTPKTKENLL